MKKNKGITLVALIITIIVLLILATVAIREVTGNGIIAHAKNAAADYEKAQDEEEKQLIRLEYEMAKNRGYKGTFGKYLDEKEYEKNKGDTATVDEYIEKKYELTEGKNTSIYGKRAVGFKSKGAGLDTLIWRVFYEDENNIYLISQTADGDYPVKNLTFFDTSSYEKTVNLSKYTSGADVSAQGRAHNSIVKSLFTTTNTNRNIIATAYMTDTKVWDAYTDAEGNARWAIGSPTVELFLKSYTTLGLPNIPTATNGGDGYNFTSTGALELSQGPNEIFKLENATAAGTGNTNNRWLMLSSPMESGLYMCEVGGVGLIVHANGSNYTARPIVCIPKVNFHYELVD